MKFRMMEIYCWNSWRTMNWGKLERTFSYTDSDELNFVREVNVIELTLETNVGEKKIWKYRVSRNFHDFLYYSRKLRDVTLPQNIHKNFRLIIERVLEFLNKLG